MARICFVTQEIYPITPGGAGSLIFNSINVLSKLGLQFTLLLDLPEEVVLKAKDYFKGKADVFGIGELAAYSAELETSLGSYYYYCSYRLYEALKKLVSIQKIDFIEFNDFYGSGYYSLLAKAAGLCFHDTKLGVRLHSPWELLLANGDGADLQNYILEIRALERAALRLAEYILTPSEGYYKNTIEPFYGKGLGKVCVSPPALINWPAEVSAPAEKQNIILFFGRLQPIKGVDRFFSACMEFALQEPEAEIWMVGGDSVLARRGGSVSYQAELQSRIPEALKGRFKFTGRLSHQELSTILPSVRFAVIPGYQESFCYAAHELYMARIPLIISAMPGIVDYFEDGKNALLFDGTIGNLIERMNLLYHDKALQEQMRRPYTVLDNQPGDAYQGLLLDGGQLEDGVQETRPPLSTLVIVLCDQEDHLPGTLASLEGQISKTDQVLVLKRTAGKPDQLPVMLLDSVYYIFNRAGEPIMPDSARTRDIILILTAGDRVRDGAITQWAHTLCQNSQISFAGSWQRWKSEDGNERISRYPAEISLESLLDQERPARLRYAMRTQPGRRLDDLFDLRMGELGELDYLWQLDETVGPGLIIPEVLVDCGTEQRVVFTKNHPLPVSYLVEKDLSMRRTQSLALKSVILSHNANAEDSLVLKVKDRLAKYPFIKRIIKKLLSRLI